MPGTPYQIVSFIGTRVMVSLKSSANLTDHAAHEFSFRLNRNAPWCCGFRKRSLNDLEGCQAHPADSVKVPFDRSSGLLIRLAQTLIPLEVDTFSYLSLNRRVRSVTYFREFRLKEEQLRT